MLPGKTVGVDSTLLEANAAMKTIVRRDNGDDWKDYLRKLAAEAGIDNPTDEDLRRFDRQRKGKKVSNEEWVSPADPDSRIAKMKDGTTHLAYKAEHVVDLETELIVAAPVYPADQPDSATLLESVVEAQVHLLEAESGTSLEELAAQPEEVVTELTSIEEARQTHFNTHILKELGLQGVKVLRTGRKDSLWSPRRAISWNDC